MRLKHLFALALTFSCTACGLLDTKPGGFSLPVPASTTGEYPRVIDPNQSLAGNALVDAMADKRVLFIGEVHDSVAHHQNQLQILQSLYAHYPNLAIGVEEADLCFALGAAQAIYGGLFNAVISLKALSYFGDGDLPRLPGETKQFLAQAAAAVREIPVIQRLSDKIAN